MILGELIADPVQRTSSAGRIFATATVRTGAGGESILVGVSTFSESAAAKLLELRKGDSLAATGPFESNRWTDRDGNERQGWRLTASQILTTYEAGKRRNKAAELDRQTDDKHGNRRAGQPESFGPDAGSLDF
ncbi:MAG: single-stranded DNA-binding protein [Burkholderiaceae bacterium]